MMTSSVGKKIIMALTGLFLCLYLVAHLSGNLLLLKQDGGTTFNQYAEFMEGFWLTRIIEVILFLGFLFHIADGIFLTVQNKNARPIGYAVNNPTENSRWVSRNMGFTGSIVFAFLVLHLRTFFVDQRFLHQHGSMYEATIVAFKSPYYSSFYIIAIAILGFHLNHGFQSAFQSLGINHEKYTPFIKFIGILFSLIIPIGFIIITVYVYAKL